MEFQFGKCIQRLPLCSLLYLEFIFTNIKMQKKNFFILQICTGNRIPTWQYTPIKIMKNYQSYIIALQETCHIKKSIFFGNLFHVTLKLFPVRNSINRCITRQANHSLFTTPTVNINKSTRLNNQIISDILSKAQFGKCQEATRRSKPSIQWFQLMMHPLQSCSTRRNF